MKKVLSLILALLMLLSVLAACGSAPVGDNSTANHPDGDTDSAAPNTDESPAVTEDPTSAEPVTISLPITDEVTSYSFWVPNFIDSATPYNDPNEFPIWQALEEKTNIHINWELGAVSNAAEQFSLMLTSQDYTDLFAGVGEFLVGGIDYSIEEDIIVDLADLVPQHMPNYYELLCADEYSRKCSYTDTGKLGGLHPISDSREPCWYGWVVRQDMLDAIGFEGAMETIDDWDTVLAGLKEAGLGYLYLGATTGQSDLLMSAYDVSSSFLQKDGTVFYGPTDPGYHDYLAKLVEWTQAGYIDPDNAGRTTGWYTDFPLLVSGEAAIMPTLYTMFDLISAMGADVPDFKLTHVDVPKLHAGDKQRVGNFAINLTTLGGSITCVSTACKDIPTILHWFDWFFTAEGTMLTNYGIEGESYDLVDGEPVWTAYISNNPDGYTKAQMQGLYQVHSYIVQHYDFTRAGSGLSDAAMEYQNIWASDFDYDNFYTLPGQNALSLTAEESEDIGSRESDIRTYVEEYTALVVAGQKDLESTWDAYVANVEAMGVQECIDIYQAAYDRFLAR